jgi:hypothetical protein
MLSYAKEKHGIQSLSGEQGLQIKSGDGIYAIKTVFIVLIF